MCIISYRLQIILKPNLILITQSWKLFSFPYWFWTIEAYLNKIRSSNLGVTIVIEKILEGF
jgi:hypothetical protein